MFVSCALFRHFLRLHALRFILLSPRRRLGRADCDCLMRAGVTAMPARYYFADKSKRRRCSAVAPALIAFAVDEKIIIDAARHTRRAAMRRSMMLTRRRAFFIFHTLIAPPAHSRRLMPSLYLPFSLPFTCRRLCQCRRFSPLAIYALSPLFATLPDTMLMPLRIYAG